MLFRRESEILDCGAGMFLGVSKILMTAALVCAALGISACGEEAEKTVSVSEKSSVSESAAPKVSPKGPRGEARVSREGVTLCEAEGVSVLMYHMIGDEPDNGAILTEKNFRRQLELIRAGGFHPISMEELYAYVTEGAPLPEKPVCITFDDGYTDNYSIVYPLMKEYGYPWTVFVITGDVGKPNRMTWEQLSEMAESRAVTIASHTATHPELAQISPAAARVDLETAQKALRDRLGIENHWLAYPYGSYNAEVMEIVKSLGIRMVVTSDGGRVHKGDSPYRLRRAWIGNEVTDDNYLERLTRDDYTPVY